MQTAGARPRPLEAAAAPDPAAVSWRCARTLADLADIHDPAVNLVWMPRALGQALGAEVASLLQAWPGEQRDTVAVNPWADEHRPRPAAGPSPLPTLPTPVLRADVALLVDVFAHLLDLHRVGVRLSTLRHAMCPRFHTDRVVLRLLCTYAGSGTEWLADDAVDRARLGHRAAGMPDACSGALRGRVREIPAGAIALLKGEAWPGFEGRGCVHRSPAADDDAPRLVLTLDALG